MSYREKRSIEGVGLYILTVLGIGMLVPGIPTTARSEQPAAKTYIALLKDRPAPDLAKLVARSKPSEDWEDSREAFYDILTLRTGGNEKAVPILSQILEDDISTGRIHGYAAAQALYCIGTPEAHKILKKHLVSNHYRAGLGINYTTHWEMDPAKATAFIERYHLQNTSNDLRLQLTVKSVDDQFQLTLTINNVLKAPVRFVKPEHNPYSLFHVQDATTGQFLRPSRHKECFSSFNWIDLAPGEKESLEVVIPRAKISDLWGPEQIVRPGGQVKLYAILEQISYEGQKNAPPNAKAWTGRVVSNPIEISTPN